MIWILSYAGSRGFLFSASKENLWERVILTKKVSKITMKSVSFVFSRCLFDRNHSQLRSLARLPDSDDFVKSQVGLLFALLCT